MATLADLKAQNKRDVEGVWKHFSIGIEFKIAKLNNSAYMAELKKLSAPHLKRIRNGEMKQSERDEIETRAMAKAVLVGWKNLENANGTKLAYSAKKAYDFLTDEKLGDVYSFVMTEANRQSNFEAEVKEDSAKN